MKKYEVKTKTSLFEVNVIDNTYTVSESYKRDFEEGDIVYKESEVYKIEKHRFVPIQGGSCWEFQYLVEHVSGMRESPIGWNSLDGFQIQQKTPTMEKSDKIKALVLEMLSQSYEAMLLNVDRAVSVVDKDDWDESNGKMIIPKCIVMAIMQDESEQYSGKGLSIERKLKKIVRNIRYQI